MKPPAPRPPARGSDGTADVVGLSHDGRGVARIDGKTLFIDGALPGERVRYRVTRGKPRFDEARLLELLSTSPERVQPACPHFGHCGGCALQHLSPAGQLADRREQLASALERIGKLRPREWLAPVASAAYGYRSRARLAVAFDPASRRATLGFRRSSSHAVEPVAECAVLEPALSALIAPLAELLSGLDNPERVREVWLASGEPGLAAGVALAAAPGPADEAALEHFCGARGVTLHTGLMPHAGSAIAWTGNGPALSYAAGADGPLIEFQPWHFTQANRGVNRALVSAVLAALEPRANDRVLELFCGLGNFSLPLARHSGQLTGVEGDAALVERATHNARANGVLNASFVQADLAVAPARSGWAAGRHDLVLLDPPRAGAPALVPLLARLGARRIAYVSCDAATLARDAAALCAGGRYVLRQAGVLDMFPQTRHFESLAVFAARV